MNYREYNFPFNLTENLSYMCQLHVSLQYHNHKLRHYLLIINDLLVIDLSEFKMILNMLIIFFKNPHKSK